MIFEYLQKSSEINIMRPTQSKIKSKNPVSYDMENVIFVLVILIK